ALRFALYKFRRGGNRGAGQAGQACEEHLAPGLLLHDYRLRTNNCKKPPIPHAEGGQVERRLA
ncbi:hypothetical protein KA005_62095, partial [bacterium]|nr:hypothetical protein [bacterium]